MKSLLGSIWLCGGLPPTPHPYFGQFGASPTPLSPVLVNVLPPTSINPCYGQFIINWWLWRHHSALFTTCRPVMVNLSSLGGFDNNIWSTLPTFTQIILPQHQVYTLQVSTYMALTKLATQSVLAVPLMCMKLARIQNFKIRLFGVFDKKNGGQFWGGDYSHLSWHNFPHIPYVIFVTNIRYELPHWNKKTHDKKKYIYYYLRASWINISEEWLKLLVFASHILSGWPKNICLGYPITFPWQKNFVLKLLAFPSHSSNILVGWRLRWLRKKLQKKLN